MISGKNSAFLQHSLHIFVLSGFVFAQPLLQIIGANVEFLVAQRIEGTEVLALAIVLSLVFPGLLVLVEFIALLISNTLYKTLHGSLIFLLVTGLLVLLLKKFAIAGFIVIALALLLGLCLVYCYQRFSIIKTYLNYLSPAIIAFPVLFLINSQVTKLLIGDPEGNSIDTQISSTTSIVMVIFDELPMTSLLSENGEIDALHFPNYARLASDSVWFRNANTVAHQTLKSVPAILSGIVPDNNALPILSDYPNNLFTLVQGSYSQSVFEPLTSLCPRSVCRETTAEEPVSVTFNGLYSDLAVVYAHLILPTDMSGGLPDITTNWNSFRTTPPQSEREIHEIIPTLWGGQRAVNFSDFIGSIGKQERPTLNFIHVLLPHQIWEYLPSGKRYHGPWRIAGLSNEQWDDDEWLVTQGYQRHLLQVQYTDTLIGNLLDRLEELDLYEESLVIVTADHGAGFWPGFSRRVLGKEKFTDDLMNVPLFIKLPHRQYKGAYDYNVKTTDIFPTITAIIAPDIMWHMDGKSILTMLAADKEPGNSVASYQPNESLALKYQLFSLSDPQSDFFNIGPFVELVGKGIDEFKITMADSMDYQLDQIDPLRIVDLDSARLPAHITGKLLNQPATEVGLDLAIALNNIIVAVTKTSIYNNQVHFSAMIRESQLQNGNNHFELYSVSEGSRGVSLDRLRNPYDERYDYFTDDSNDETQIASSVGKTMTVSAGHLVGHLDRVEQIDDELVIAGWAIDKEHAVGADYLLLDIDGKLSYVTRIDGSRPDVARAHNLASAEITGFSFKVTMDRFNSDRIPKVKLLAVSRDGYVSEILAGLSISETLVNTATGR